MKLDEYTTPAPSFAEEHAPRPDASRIVAARHRANAEREEEPPPARFTLPLDTWLPSGILIGIVALAIAMSSVVRPLPTATPVPTVIPTSAPALIVPTVAPKPTIAPTPAPTAPPQTGQGLTIAPAVENVPAEAPEQPVDVVQPATAPTMQAIREWIGATSTATYATAAALGVPGGVIPQTPTPEGEVR